jgi:hypothetical protein
MAEEWTWQKVYLPPHWEPVKIVNVLRHPPPHFDGHTENFEKILPGRHQLGPEQTLTSFWLAPGKWQVIVKGMLGAIGPSDAYMAEVALVIHAEPSDYWPQGSSYQATTGFSKAPVTAVLHVSSTHPMLVTVSAAGLLAPGFLDELRVIATRE